MNDIKLPAGLQLADIPEVSPNAAQGSQTAVVEPPIDESKGIMLDDFLPEPLAEFVANGQQAVTKGLYDAGVGATQAVSDIQKQVGGTMHTLGEAAHQAMKYREEIDKLGEGDDYSMMVGGMAGSRVFFAGNAHLSASNMGNGPDGHPTYSLSLGGDFAKGFFQNRPPIDLPGALLAAHPSATGALKTAFPAMKRLGIFIQMFGGATGGGQGKLDFHFSGPDAKEQLKKTMEALFRPMEKLQPWTKEDMVQIFGNVSAIELGGIGTGFANALLGPGYGGIRAIVGMGGINAMAGLVGRIDFGKDTEVPVFTLRADLTLTASFMHQFGGGIGPYMFFSYGLGDVNAGVSFSIQSRHSLDPEKLEGLIEALKEDDPQRAHLENLKSKVSGSVTFNYGYNVKKDALGGSNGERVSVTYSGDPFELSGALQKAVADTNWKNFDKVEVDKVLEKPLTVAEQALSAASAETVAMAQRVAENMSDEVMVNMASTPITSHGISKDLGVVGPWGLYSGHVAVLRNDIQDPKWGFLGNGLDAIPALAEVLQGKSPSHPFDSFDLQLAMYLSLRPEHAELKAMLDKHMGMSQQVKAAESPGAPPADGSLGPTKPGKMPDAQEFANLTHDIKKYMADHPEAVAAEKTRAARLDKVVAEAKTLVEEFLAKWVPLGYPDSVSQSELQESVLAKFDSVAADFPDLDTIKRMHVPALAELVSTAHYAQMQPGDILWYDQSPALELLAGNPKHAQLAELLGNYQGLLGLLGANPDAQYDPTVQDDLLLAEAALREYALAHAAEVEAALPAAAAIFEARGMLQKNLELVVGAGELNAEQDAALTEEINRIVETLDARDPYRATAVKLIEQERSITVHSHNLSEYLAAQAQAWGTRGTEPTEAEIQAVIDEGLRRIGELDPAISGVENLGSSWEQQVRIAAANAQLMGMFMGSGSGIPDSGSGAQGDPPPVDLYETSVSPAP
jgi:hypothetical protein